MYVNMVCRQVSVCELLDDRGMGELSKSSVKLLEQEYPVDISGHFALRSNIRMAAKWLAKY